MLTTSTNTQKTQTSTTTTTKKVTPKQGTAVMFDGKYLHTAYQSNKHMRCIINFNIDGSYEENINRKENHSLKRHIAYHYNGNEIQHKIKY